MTKGLRRRGSDYKPWVCVRFQARAESGRQPSAGAGGCGGRRIHPDRPGVDRGSRRDTCRSATAAGYQLLGLPAELPILHLSADATRNLGAKYVFVTSFMQPSEALQTIGIHNGTWLYVLFQERDQG